MTFFSLLERRDPSQAKRREAQIKGTQERKKGRRGNKKEGEVHTYTSKNTHAYSQSHLAAAAAAFSVMQSFGGREQGEKGDKYKM